MNEAERKATRLKECGLVYYERLRDGKCWIGPPGDVPPAETGRVKVLALSFVEPKPQMEIHAHFERYLVARNFRGTWFDVKSPHGKALVP